MDHYTFTLYLVVIFNNGKTATHKNMNFLCLLRDSKESDIISIHHCPRMSHPLLTCHHTMTDTLKKVLCFKEINLPNLFPTCQQMTLLVQPGYNPDKLWNFPPAEMLPLWLFMDNWAILKDHYLPDEKMWMLPTALKHTLLLFGFVFLTTLHHWIANYALLAHWLLSPVWDQKHKARIFFISDCFHLVINRCIVPIWHEHKKKKNCTSANERASMITGRGTNVTDTWMETSTGLRGIR